MYSIKPTGDSVAQEFLRIMGQNKKIVKEAELQDSADDFEEKLNKAQRDSEGSDQGFIDWMNALKDSAQTGGDEASDGALEDMIIDDAADGVEGINLAQELLESIEKSFPPEDKKFASSEERVLEGLSKIAGSLRGKGESFAADVVEATAKSIKEDLVKEASENSFIISELRKMADEFYAGSDQLAGDMVMVTLGKIAKEMPAKDPAKQKDLLKAVPMTPPTDKDPCAEKFKVGTTEYEKCREKAAEKSEMSKQADDQELTMGYWLDECSKKLNKPRGSLGVKNCAKKSLEKAKKKG